MDASSISDAPLELKLQYSMLPWLVDMHIFGACDSDTMDEAGTKLQ
ncbi:hypothetical protein NSA56_07585 [Oceanobacillus caeni]|nr:hypothetical protein [Oceanobacillus caeni]MCR1834258.1 hypothetical protein [Oceanobacillus caeni]